MPVSAPTFLPSQGRAARSRLSRRAPSLARSAGLAEKVRNLCEMGFPEAAVRNALQKCGGDENTALEMLLSGV